MNKGMPNTAKLLATSLTAASGIGGIFGWLLRTILSHAFKKGIQQGLIFADRAHIALIVKNESNEWAEELENAYQIIDKSGELTQEQKDAIDKPVMDAFIKLATFRLSDS